MIALERARLRIAPPAGWSRVPRTAVVDWAERLVGNAGQAAVARLVAVAAAAVAEQPSSTPLVFVGDRAVAQAWAFLRLVPRRDPDQEQAAAGAERTWAARAEEGDVAVWHREGTRATVGGSPAAVLADLLTIDRGDVREVQRRVVVAWFPPEPVCLHLTVSTPSSTVFGDLVATALELAGGITLEEPA